MKSTAQQDCLYMNATAHFLRALYESKQLDELQILDMSGWSEAWIHDDGSVDTGDPGSYSDWQHGLATLLKEEDLANNEVLLYFEVMRCYIRHWFVRGKRSEVYLRDILSWTEFSTDRHDLTQIHTANPLMWPLWLQSVENAKRSSKPQSE